MLDRPPDRRCASSATAAAGLSPGVGRFEPAAQAYLPGGSSLIEIGCIGSDEPGEGDARADVEKVLGLEFGVDVATDGAVDLSTLHHLLDLLDEPAEPVPDPRPET